MRWSASAVTRCLTALRTFAAGHPRVGAYVESGLERVPFLRDAIGRLVRGDAQETYERWVEAYDTVGDGDVAAIRDEIEKLADPPFLSVIVPLADTDAAVVERFADSLLAQAYDRWEAEFVGAPAGGGVAASVERLASRDPRFRGREGVGSVAETLNAALESAAGEFAVVADVGTSPRPHALFLFATALERAPDAVLVYGDEDAIDDSGRRHAHYFKPEWNEALLRSQNYLGDLVCFRRSSALAAGGFLEERDGDWAWGLFLRLTAAASPGAVHHLPFVLSHRWGRVNAKPRDEVARATEDRLANLGEPAQVEPAGEASYRTRYRLPREPPRVSVIVPTTCELDLLRPCVDSVLNRTSYSELELLLVVNGMRGTPEQLEYLRGLETDPRVRVTFLEDRPYNFSKTNNWAAEQVRGELLCFLNDDTEVITADWLSALVGQVLRRRVGAAGALLLYPNGGIQHAGVVLGAGGVAAHLYRSLPSATRGYHDRAQVDQDVSCVSAACVLVRREAFAAVGGFDESLAVAFNDVDLCLRLREAGWRIVWTPSARLYHRESSSLGRHYGGDEQTRWRSEWDLVHDRWGAALTSDPHYNPNLSLDALRLWQPAFPPRVSYPWRREAIP